MSGYHVFVLCNQFVSKVLITSILHTYQQVITIIVITLLYILLLPSLSEVFLKAPLFYHSLTPDFGKR